MKIISLRFANLNSLPGPYHIRFDQPPLADTGLFAITGPTGAGKSTLLDAIAVGLYGRVPRHDREVREMVSRHADEAWAEVEFEVRPPVTEAGAPDRVRYRSRWQITRKTRGKDKGGLNQDAMTLVHCATGQALASGKASVPDKVSELSGLDFRQFEQAILLSQGNFARFLHAPEPERSALLEKMTNVGIYSQLSVAAFEKARAEEQATRLLEASLNATRLLPPDERRALEQQLAGLEQDVELTYEHLQELSAHLAWRTQADQLDKRLADNERDLAALAQTTAQLRPEAEQLAGHERAATLRLPLSLAAAARHELAQDAEALARLHHELPALSQVAAAAATACQAADLAHAQAQAEAERLRPVLLEAQRQDARLAAAGHQLADQQAAHARHARELAADQATQQALAAGLASLDQQQQELSSWLLAHNHENSLDKALEILHRDLHDLSEATRHLARLEAGQEQLLRQLDAATTARHAHQQAAEAAARHQQALREREQPVQAALAALLNGQQPADLLRAAADLTQHLHQLQRLLPLVQAAQELAARAATLQAACEAANLTLLPATTALAQLEKDLTAARLLLDSYEHTHRLQQALADLNSHRHQLQPGVACPLCGATEHRYAAGYLAHADEQARRVQAQKQAVQDLEQTLRHASEAVVRQRTEQQQRQLRQQEAAAAAASARHQAATLAGAQPGLPLQPAALEQALAHATTAHAQATAACARLAELEQQVRELRIGHDEAREQARLADQLATGAGHRVQLSQQELAGLKSSMAEHRAAAADYRHVVQATLAPHQLSLPAAAPYDGVLATLAERAATFARQRQALADTQDAHRGRQAEHRTRAAALLRREADHAATATALAGEQAALAAARAARLAHYPGPDPAADEQALHQAARQLTQAARHAHDEQARHQQRLTSHHERTAQRQTDQQRHQATLDQQQAELAAALAAARFATADEAELLLLPPDEAERLTGRQRQHTTRQQAAAQLHQQLSAELAGHYELAPTPRATTALQVELKQLHAENEKLHQRYGGVARLLEHDDHARQQQADGLRELLLRQQEQQRWHDLAEQIGSATGAKFSQFAQGLTLAHLARLANLRLRQLTTRYTILKTPDQNLELRIIDHDQADTVRPMASLSGGESFLVSLALALGLSELAGHQARIESLFIDEGFGSLDPESLNMALDALERLQHSGKMIGVISHVADLKERIATQIRVQPTSGGNSTVRVVGLNGAEVDCETDGEQ